MKTGFVLFQSGSQPSGCLPSSLNTAYSYNGFGDLLGLGSPDTGTTTSTYDAAGRLATRTDARNITATYGYGPISQAKAATAPPPVPAMRLRCARRRRRCG